MGHTAMEKKVVYRKCPGCGKMFDRNELIKITVDSATKKVVLNPDNKTFGRSVYICKNKDCINSVLKKGRLFKNLRTKPDEGCLSYLQSFVG